MNFRTKRYSLLCWLNCSHGFYTQKQNSAKHFYENIVPMISYYCVSAAAAARLDWHHVTFAAVPNRPCAAAGTPILALSMVYISMVWPLLIFGNTHFDSRTDSQVHGAEYCIVGISHNTAI